MGRVVVNQDSKPVCRWNIGEFRDPDKPGGTRGSIHVDFQESPVYLHVVRNMAGDCFISEQGREIHDIAFGKIVIGDQITNVCACIGQGIRIEYKGVGPISAHQDITASASIEEIATGASEKRGT